LFVSEYVFINRGVALWAA